MSSSYSYGAYPQLGYYLSNYWSDTMSERKYLKLLNKAQLATTRKEARKVLKKARKLELIENDFQLNALKKACE